MDKLLFAILASAGAAFAALAPAGADPLVASKGARVVRIHDGRMADASAPACRIEMRWKRDYSGRPYLKKVRICV
jgi:hypothetical protein